MGLGLVVVRLLGRGLEELDVFGLGLARDLDVLGEAVEGVAHDAVVGEDEGGLAVVVPAVGRGCLKQFDASADERERRLEGRRA